MSVTVALKLLSESALTIPIFTIANLGLIQGLLATMDGRIVEALKQLNKHFTIETEGGAATIQTSLAER